MIIFGAILIWMAILTKIVVLETVGIVILLAGAGLYSLGSTGHAIGGRRHYW